MPSVVGESKRLERVEPPRYIVIADELEKRWRRLAPNSLVESETQVAGDFEVNRQTARDVFRERERRSAVRRIVGRGTFTALKLDYPIERGRPPSFRRVIHAAGLEHAVDQIELRWRRATTTAPRTLVSARVIAVDGLVAAHATDEFPEPVGAQVRDDVGRGASIFDVLTATGATPWRRRVTVSLGQPDGQVSDALGYANSPQPTWCVRSETVDAGTGDLVHWSATWMRNDVFDVQIRLDLPVELDAR